MIQRPRLRQLLDQLAAADEAPTDLLPELDLLRALIIDYIERYDEMTEALLSWHASFGPEWSKQYGDWSKAFEGWREWWDEWTVKFAAYRESVESNQAHYALGWPEPPALPEFVAPPSPPTPAETATKPRQVVDILDVAKFLTSIGSLSERLEKRQAAGTISLQALDHLTEQFGVELVAAARETIHDESVRAALLSAAASRWGTLAVPTAGMPATAATSTIKRGG